jgi:hypothetical protein
MKYLISLLLFVSLPAIAANVTLSWDHYTDTGLPANTAYDPAGYTIDAQCRVNAGTYAAPVSTGAISDSQTVAVTANPGDTIGCQIRATRTSDKQSSAWTGEVSGTVPLLPPSQPAALKLNF